MSEQIPILCTKFSTLEKTECYFSKDGMLTNYYCTVECDNGQKSLYEKREWYYNPEYDSGIFELPDTVLYVATAVNITDKVETDG